LRYIYSFTVSEPFLVSKESESSNEFSVHYDTTSHEDDVQTNTEWVQIEVVGQSFLLHQIRKMVATATDFARRKNTDPTSSSSSSSDGVSNDDLSQESIAAIQQSLEPCKVKTTMVPGLGLYLDRPFFCDYNSALKRLPPRPQGGVATNVNAAGDVPAATVASSNSEDPTAAAATATASATASATAGGKEEDEERRELFWEEGEISETLKQFKATVIWPHIFQHSYHDGTFSTWLNTLDCYPNSYTPEAAAPIDAPIVLTKPCALEPSS
jgi:hypothetical protein